MIKLKEVKRKKSKPNIIYILADDMGYGDLSCLNEESQITTPNFDKLAQEGMIFTDAHSSSAVCTPSRYSIITGRYNWRSRLKSSVLGGYSPALIEPERMTVAPDNAAEDSVSNLPIWFADDYTKPLREATVHHSVNGSFSLRKGKWKLELYWMKD